MKMTKLALAAAAAMTAATPALADLVIPTLNYRTGPFAPNGIPYADGFSDYLKLLNARDGGVGGVEIRELECETAYNTQKGVECYEATKGEGALVYIPQSTGITYQLIPKASVDEIPVHSIGYGRTSAADGKVFEWIFNYPGTYWDAASILTKHALEMEGGSLEGKNVVLLHHNSAYGREPIRTLEELATKHGFTLSLLPVDSPGQVQNSQWLEIRRSRPDFVFFWGWGVMNQVAIQEAANIRFPMDRFMGVWWSGAETDVLPAGAGADGYKAITWHQPGMDFPIYDDLKTHVYDAGNTSGDGAHIGTVLYNRGLYAAIVTTEAIRKAQEIHGVADITPPMMRDGMEALEITADRWAELGLEDFTGPISISCEDHGAPGVAAIQQWDASAEQWTLVTDFIEPDKDVVDALIVADAAAYAQEQGITPRTCE
ncbi:MAG: ABC transporter substrate-binding protein [Pseudomonadota bacterium]